MSIDVLMPHTATVLSRSQRTDRANQRVNAFDPKLEGVACRLTNARGRQIFELENKEAVHADYTLFVPKDTDIAETDRIGEVVDKTGRVLAADLIVLLVRPGSTGDGVVHHIEVPCAHTRVATRSA